MKLSFATVWDLVKRSINGWIDDRASSMGAALAYYTAFSLSPLLLIAIAIASLFFDSAVARQAVVDTFGGLVGASGAEAIEGLLESGGDATSGVIGAIIGAVTLAIGATTVFAELQSDLDIIWKTPPDKTSGIWAFIRARFLSFGLVLSIGFLLIASLLLSTILAAAASYWSSWFEGMEFVLHILDFVVSTAVTTGLFALIYKLLPTQKIAWNDVWIGALVTALLFALGKFLIGLYLGNSAVSSSFGAAGAFVVLVVWLYYSAQVFLLGAEFTYAYSTTMGSLANASAAQPAGSKGTERAPEPAVPISHPAMTPSTHPAISPATEPPLHMAARAAPADMKEQLWNEAQAVVRRNAGAGIWVAGVTVAGIALLMAHRRNLLRF